MTLPALPWLSCPRLMVDNNPSLHHLPYLVGCQQSIVTYSSQASWAVMAAPVAQNIMEGVWNIRLYGCSEDGHQQLSDDNLGLVTVQVSSSKKLLLPENIDKISNIPSLIELSLRKVYAYFYKPKFCMKITVTEDLHLYIPSTTLDQESTNTSDDLQLPMWLMEKLSRGPSTFCCRPSCCGPIFMECFLQVLENDVQRTWLGGGNLEKKTFLAIQYFCSQGCFLEYCNDPKLSEWEKQLLKRNVEFKTL